LIGIGRRLLKGGSSSFGYSSGPPRRTRYGMYDAIVAGTMVSIFHLGPALFDTGQVCVLYEEGLADCEKTFTNLVLTVQYFQWL